MGSLDGSGELLLDSGYITGTAWQTIAPTVTPAQTLPIYRFWSPVFGNAHFYTADAIEAHRLINSDPNWRFEGISFQGYAASNGTCVGHAPVYRFFSPLFNAHFYTADENEKTHLRTNDPNWQYEGLAYCADAAHEIGTSPVSRFWSPIFGKHFYTAVQNEKDQLISNDRNWTYEGVAYFATAP